MKKWHKVLIIIVCVIAVLGVLGAVSYKYFLEPVVEEKVEQVGEKVQAVIKDETFQETVDDVAQSMIDEGVITQESIPTYNQFKLDNERRKANMTEEEKKAVEEREQKAKATPTPTPTPKPVKKKSLYEKLKEAMTADEFAFALSMYNRIDIGYAQSLLKTDRAAAKRYIKSKASSGEISRALEIYAKYSYLLD